MGSFMNKIKIRFSIIITLLIAFVFAMGFAVGSIFPQRMHASAATTYEPAKIFSAGAGSTVTAFKTGTDEADKAYVGFSMKQNESRVYYRRSLAYKWFEKAEATEEETLANPGKPVYFSMTFSFPQINFKEFSLTFECDEENVTKDGKSSNKIAFEMTEDGIGARVSPSVGEMSNLRHKSSDITDWTGDFTLSFIEGKTAGEFILSLVYTDGVHTLNYFDDTESDRKQFVFNNIGDNYAEYRSSAASKPNTPIIFMTKFEEEEEAAEGEEEKETEQKILIKELNGQTLEVTGYTVADDAQLTGGTVAVTGGSVADNQAPALVLSETLYSFVLGQKYALTHHAIDVLDDSVTVTRRYYNARKGEDGKLVKPDETSTDDYESLTTSKSFLPLDDTENIAYFSIRFELEDGRTKAEGEKDYVYLSWYADSSALFTENGWDYIKAEKDRQDPAYKIITTDTASGKGVNTETTDYEEMVNAYQELVTAAAAKTSAGEGAYIYLPSLRDLIGSKSADYRNLKFNVSYFTKQQNADSSPLSQTSLSYNALKLPVNIEGEYCFRVYATDAAGNAIKLYDDEGKLVDVTSSNVWDFDIIPTFTFKVDYKGASIEDSGEQTLGYRESSYNIKSFEIVALSGYETDYALYYFDESKLEGTDKSVPSYSQFVQDVKKYMEEKDYEVYKNCLTEIQPFNSEYNKDDEEWDATDNDYNWNPKDSSLSFVPQHSGFYVVKVTVSDAHMAGKSVDGYQVIEIRNPIDVTPGRSNWLANNKLSVILFSISGALAVAIVVLLVVKPSEKTPEDVDLNKLKGKKKEKPAKK